VRCLIVLLCSLSATAAAQPFGLASVDWAEHHWFDGADLLVTTTGGHTVLRHRSGATRELPGAGGAVDALGTASNLRLISVGRKRIGRLEDGRWRVHAREEISSPPDGVALAPDGSALAWYGLYRQGRLLAVSPENEVTRVEVPRGHAPVLVTQDPGGGFLVVLRSTISEHTFLRYADGVLAPHPRDAELREELPCRSPDGALALDEQRLLLYNDTFFCVVDPAAGLQTRTLASELLGEGNRHVEIVTRRGAGELIVVEGVGDDAYRWSLVDDGITPVGRLPLSARDEVFVDPRSGHALVLGSRATHHELELDSVSAPPSDAAWLADLEVDEEIEGLPDAPRGLQFAIPVIRIGFGGAAQLDPSGPGAFAFDLVGGGRLFFRGGDVHPTLSAEAGYSRRGGDQDTHDLTLGLVAGVTAVAFGVAVAETLVFSVGERDAFGLRTALRLGMLWHAIELEVAHGIELEPRRHELRVQLVLDLGIIIGIGSVLRTINRIAS